MKLLGVDYGRKKIGLAIADSESGLSAPYLVIKYDQMQNVIKKVSRIIAKEKVQKIVVGISEGKMEAESREFRIILRRATGVSTTFWDETLRNKSFCFSMPVSLW